MEQLAFFPEIDDKTQKTIEKEVIKVLKEYRALKIRMENQQENRMEGISLFPEIRDTRKISDIKFKQIDKALTYCLDEDESEIIKKKYLSNKRLKDEVIYEEIGLYKNAYYAKKRTALRLIATSLGMI
ncbi:ArpU family phage packaging/lysis transcriptional regulator [Bacillus cereus group sp. RP32]|uniref:ArpU family phage packaging/lysis transcriptional regulator n=1 Tax=Bacillus cereus group sp. RP32 TaxID=3040258 RepID=UPI003396CD69